MYNIQTSSIPSTILRNKLARASRRLQSQASPSGTNPELATYESLLAEAAKILSKFYKTLSEPTFKPNEVLIDTPPDTESFNSDLAGIQDDLEIIFSEFENLETVILGNFNYMVSRLNRLNRKMKETYSLLGDFVLFSNLPIKDAIFYTDSFNNLSRIEFDSPLLNKEQCEVNQVEGIVTLPIDRGAQVPINISQQPILNASSNGRIGNNEEVSAKLHGSISDILDNNADTWFEYERVVTSDDGIPLILDFTINMGSERVVNFIRINPNNFGTRNQVQVLAIDTSIDGDDFVSVKDDIPIVGFVTEDEDNVFSLAPSTSKFAGQGLYTFTPRKAKYIHLTLKQDTPYVINTSSGIEKFRYAIGIRDVEIAALPYKVDGEIISKQYSSNDPVRKVVVISNQNPDSSTVSNLAKIRHFVSPDNGITWHEIRPRNSSGIANSVQDIPELIDFNGVVEGTVNTESPIVSLRYKAVMHRNSEGFSDSSEELAQKVASNTELHTPPTTTPFEFQLQNRPLKDTIKLIDPQFGSRGIEEVKYRIATGNGSKKIILLPFKPLRKDYQKEETSPGSGEWTLEEVDPQKVYVDGELWSRDTLTGSNKHYKLHFPKGRLEFGDGTNGKAVPSGAIISMTLSEERLHPGRGADHVALLDYPTSIDKGQTEIAIYHPIASSTNVLKKGAKIHQLEKLIEDGSLSISPSPGSEVDFVDGESEFAISGEYSVDYENGVLYLKSRTSSATNTTAIFKYTPKTILEESQWDFIDVDGLSDKVSISDSAYRTFEADTLNIPDGVVYFNLAHLSIVRGTLSFSGVSESVLSDIVGDEVPYVDGQIELLGVIQSKEQLEAITGASAGDVINIPFKVKVSSDTSLSVTFSNSSVFGNLVGSDGAVDSGSPGDYYVNRSGGTTGYVRVKLSGNVADPGVVTYYYTDPQANLTGRYSVNYETGEVFLHDPTVSSMTVDYEYTDIRARYNIARQVSSSDWSYNESNNKIVIKDREILRNVRTPQTSEGNVTFASKFYQASYRYIDNSRADVSELEPYFSPVLKDYTLKVVTESRLV